MILHRLRLTDFRGTAERDVVFEDRGVTVVVGPNEIGKSSLPEALRLVREFKASSKHSRIQSVQPIGRDVGPAVEIEVTTGPYRFVYRKQWLKGRSTTLDILEPRPEQLTGDEAHDRVEAMFDETLDADLWDALHQVQGASLDQPFLAGVMPLRQALLAASDGHTADETHGDLMDRIAAERDRYFTASGRPRDDYARAIDEVERLTTEMAALEDEFAGVQSRVDRHASLTAERDDLRAGLADRERSLDELEQQYEQVAGLMTRRATVSEAVGRTSEVVNSASRAAEERATQIADLEAARAAAAESAAAVEVLRADEEEALAEVRRADDQADDVGESIAQARQSLRDAEESLASVREGHQLQVLRQRLERAERASAELADTARALVANRVTAEALQRLTDVDTERRTAEASLTSGAAQVVVERLGGADVLLDGDPGGTDATVTRDVVVEVPGAARVFISPDASARERREHAERAGRHLDETVRDLGVADLASARRRADERAELESRRARLAAELEAAAGPSGLAQLRGEIQALEARREQHEDKGVESPIDAARVAAAEAAVAATRVDVDTVERRADERRVTDAERRNAAQRLVGELIAARTRYEGLAAAVTTQQQRLETERSVRDDASVAAALESARVAHDETVAALAEIDARLASADAISLESRVENARQTLVEARATERALSDAITGLTGELEALGQQGLQSRLDAARAAVSDATREHERLHQRAQASRLLHETMVRHQRTTQQRYVAPFREAVESLVRIVLADDVRVEIADDLSIAACTRDGVTVPFAALSGGTREQLALIGRLATARLVDPDTGAPVILDDAFGFSDPVRRSALGAVLKVAGERAQVVVLTCDPGRLSIGGASVVRLEP